MSRIKNVDDLHDRIDGVAIFEGEVIDKQVDTSGMAKAQVEVTWALHGVNAKKIIVETLENSLHGIDFEIGKNYRIAAYEENDTLRTWTWMGTYKIEDKPNCNMSDSETSTR